MKDRTPWTHDELQKLIPQLEAELKAEEDECDFELKPLPKLSQQECLDYFNRLMDTASERPLTNQECGLHGQLLCVFRQTVMAEMLGQGKDKRFMVVSEDDVARILKISDMEGSFFDAFKKEMRRNL